MTANETATTYFTTDGSNPTVSATFQYPPSLSTCGSTANCPICITTSKTLKYLSVDSSGNVEDVRVNFYFYNEKWSDPADSTAPATTMTVNGSTLSESSTLLTGDASVVLSVNEGATIYYTTDGSVPTTSSSKFEFAQNITQTTTIRYFAVDYASNVESVKTKTINILDWHSVSYSGSPPKSQYDYNTAKGMVYDASRGKILFYCHNDSGSSPCGTWTYSQGAWTQLASTALTISRNAVAYNDTEGETYMFVYPSGSGNSDYKTYKFGYTANVWTEVKSGGPSKPSNPVNGISAAYDSSSKIFLVVMSIGNTIQTYSYNSSTNQYALLNTITGDSADPTSFYRMVYDPSRSRVIAYGRVPPTAGNGLTFIGATFEFYSGTWHKVVTNEVPTLETPIYDSRRQLVYGFAADNQDTANSDSWYYTGSDWVKASPPLSKPKARKSPFIVYDAANQKTIIFGGTDRFGQLLNDMWEYRP
ncbi:MAG: chitobiase/beta-hexosaminidase C-terminal domain-containing protein [Deltaproteobacteria bacterium]|nr:chitobiase/beta-hexosaminidase C-terminal domain-containing protein [Deltaproteobacteria bacterium]